SIAPCIVGLTLAVNQGPALRSAVNQGPALRSAVNQGSALRSAVNLCPALRSAVNLGRVGRGPQPWRGVAGPPHAVSRLIQVTRVVTIWCDHIPLCHPRCVAWPDPTARPHHPAPRLTARVNPTIYDPPSAAARLILNTMPPTIAHRSPPVAPGG